MTVTMKCAVDAIPVTRFYSVLFFGGQNGCGQGLRMFCPRGKQNAKHTARTADETDKIQSISTRQTVY